MQKKHVNLKLYYPVAVILCAVITFLGLKVFESRYYYITALLMIIIMMLPFFIEFEKKQMKTSELVVIALMTAVSAVSRCLFIFLPQVKPMCAFVVTSAAAFGPAVGFVVGALSVFLSGFAFGQGAFTPFQMLGMGMTAYVCGLIFYKTKAERNKILVSVVSFFACLIIYGLTVDTCSVLMMLDTYTFESVFSVFLTGLPFNLVHAITTAGLLFFIHIPMNNKFLRLRVKYGIFDDT